MFLLSKQIYRTAFPQQPGYQMSELVETAVLCPYCGETIQVFVEATESTQYIEDCQVCCCPIVFKINISLSGELNVEVFHENDVI